MAKTRSSSPSPPPALSSSAHDPLADEPPTDEPPSYDQAAAQPPTRQYRDNPLAPPETAYRIPAQRPYVSFAAAKRLSGAVTLDHQLSASAEALEEFIDRQTRLPPRPCLIISGSHQESRNDGKTKKSETVTDFNFRIDLTRTLLRYSGPDERGQRWSSTSVIGDFDGIKAYRGGRCRSTNKTGRIALPEGDEGERLMDLENAQDVPGIKGWCERFCNDSASVKSFTYHRFLDGFNFEPMRSAFISHIRSTGYQGHIHITSTLSNGVVTIYSPHWINRLRNNPWVYYPCIILQLWILTWPVIWLMERRYDVIRSWWHSSIVVPDLTPENPRRANKLYAGGFDEATAAEMWAPVVREAAFQGKCHGEFLGEAEIEQLKRRGIERQEQRSSQGGDLISRGQAALDMMGIRRIGGVNVTGAWGGDDSRTRSSQFSVRMG